MRRPNILDVVRAVTDVAPAHPEVAVWWYAPQPDLKVSGVPGDDPSLEVVVELAEDRGDLDGLAAALSERLRGYPVEARLHRGSDEEIRLFRMLTSSAERTSA